MTDGLSTLYQDLLSESYDCVDRIVLNAYFRMGHDPGGFHVWWLALTGSDDTLDNAHLMRMAGFSRRIRGYAKAHNIPVIDWRMRAAKLYEHRQLFFRLAPKGVSATKYKGASGRGPCCSTPFSPCPVAAGKGHPGNPRHSVEVRASPMPASQAIARSPNPLSVLRLPGVLPLS